MQQIVGMFLILITVALAGGMGYQAGWMSGWKAGNMHSRETMERLEAMRKALRREGGK